VNRGDVVEADLPGLGRRPVVVVTRQAVLPFLTNVTVVLVTSRIRGLPTEVALGADQGLAVDSVANCDNVLTVPKRRVGRTLGALDPGRLRALDDALRLALDLD